MFVKLKELMSTRNWVNYTIGTALIISILTIYSAHGLSSIDEREPRKLFGGYRITPKFCRASKTLPDSDPRKQGPKICMFNHECAQRHGEVVGACMDGFLFGACCQIPDNIGSSLLQQVQSANVQSNSAAALSYETYGNNVQKTDLKTSPKPTKPSNYFTSQSGISLHYLPSSTSYGSSENNFDSSYSPNFSYDSNSNNIFDEPDRDQFYIDSGSVKISSSATSKYPGQSSSDVPQSTTPSTTSTIGDMYLPPISVSSELPTLMSSAPFDASYESVNSVEKNPPSAIITSTGLHHIADNIILEHPVIDANGNIKEEFSHSDITHPSADAVLIEDDLQFSTGYGPSTFYVPAPTQSASPSQSTKKPYQKPVFKPKPTKQTTPGTQSSQTISSDENYVLVQTISNDKPSKRPDSPTIPNNNIESIESIILMLNDTTKYGPSTETYNTYYGSSGDTQRPVVSTYSPNYDIYGPSSFYITTPKPIKAGSSTHRPISSYEPTRLPGSITTPIPSSTLLPPIITHISSTQKVPLKDAVYSSTQRPTTILVKKPPSTPHPTKRPTTQKLRPKPSVHSTSYVTGPSTSRPTNTYGSSTTSSYYMDRYPSTPSGIYSSSYGQGQISSSTQKITQQLSSENNDSSYVKIPIGTERPHPTVIITPKPTTNLVTSSSWTKQPTTADRYTVPPVSSPQSTSYIYNPVVTQRPGFISSTEEYINLPPVLSNDFDDPGYYGNTATDRPAYNKHPTAAPNDVRPAYPGYYGPTPQYPSIKLPTAPVFAENVEEEIYTSPNDFVNFPPVRNPNLNMSATSSSVTNDLNLSTPTFVEDNILKDKMNLLVSKIVDSLQGNFDALADMVDQRNASVLADTVVPTTTKRPQTSTKRTPTVPPTKTKPSPQPTRPKPAVVQPAKPKPSAQPTTIVRPTISGTKPTANRKPTVPSKKPLSTRPSPPPKKTTPKPQPTRRPSTKPTRRITTTTVQQDEFIDDDEDINNEDNQVETSTHAASGRRFQCGTRPLLKTGRIVGGKGSKFAEWPWQVLVRESTWLGLFTKNKCGGVLITNKYVITAAHCQPGFLASLVAVFGEFDISGDLETKRSVTKNVKQVVVHRQYDAATFENDLALLELETPIHYDTHIIPICMPPDDADFTGRMATVTGWGRLKYGGGVPAILQEVQVPVIENSVCQEMFHTAGHNKKILPSFLCAGYANGQKDSCEGDSGGPLVMQRDDGRWQLAGTVSHGIKCANPYLPGVYMRTTYYKPWLRSITGVK